MINISKQIYIGWDSTSKKRDELFEATVIPYEKTNSKTLTNFIEKYDTIQELDNVPLPGFTLYESNRKDWGSTDTTWLVIDPRGFLIRISSNNLSELLKDTGTTEGLIQERCIWVRDDHRSVMKLVPISSSWYIEATYNSDLMENRIDVASVNIGDTVLLQNKLEGIYMGIFTLYGSLRKIGRDKFVPNVSARRQVLQVDKDKYHLKTDIKILKVIKRANKILTTSESLDIINKSLTTNHVFTTGTHFALPGHAYYETIHHATLATHKVKLRITEVTKTDIEDLFNNNINGVCSGIILESAPGKKFLLDPYSVYSMPTSSKFSVIELSYIDDTTIYLRGDSIFRSLHDFALDNFVKFYKIEKIVKDEIYF